MFAFTEALYSVLAFLMVLVLHWFHVLPLTEHEIGAVLKADWVLLGVFAAVTVARWVETKLGARGAGALTGLLWAAELAVLAAGSWLISARLAGVWSPLALLWLLAVPVILRDAVRLVSHRGRRNTQPRELNQTSSDGLIREVFLKWVHGDQNLSLNSSQQHDGSTASGTVATTQTQPVPTSKTVSAKECLRDLTAEARAGKGKTVIGCEDVLEELEVNLGQLKPANVALIGPAGSGKSTIVEALAHAWLKRHSKRRVLLLDPAKVRAAGGFEGDTERVWIAIIAEVTEVGAVTILVIDEAHDVFKDSRVANLLKPKMADGSLHIVALSTPKEWRRDVATDSALTRRFNVINLDPPTVEQAIAIVRHQADLAAKHNSVRIPDGSVEAAVRLCDRYVTDEALPAAPVKLISQAASRAQVHGQKVVDAEAVAETLAKQLKLPVGQLVGGNTELGQLAARLGENIVGQDEVVNQVAAIVQAKLMGITDTTRPASALFSGPTGTGKTELAKALARELAPGNREALLQINGSEYPNQHDSSKLLGTGAGYIGYGNGGKLLNGAKRAQVILIDEIEKMHREVQRAILLPLLDEGELTGGDGEKVSFASKVVILTSNLGAAGASLTPKAQLDEARRFFAPEVWARIGHKLVFAPLSFEAAEGIAQTLLDTIGERMKSDQGIELRFSRQLVEALVTHGFNPDDGARSLRPLITASVESALTDALLHHDIARGQRVQVELATTTELAGQVRPSTPGERSGVDATLHVWVEG